MNEDESETQPSIRLDNFLKTSGLTSTGGEAKILIQSGQVLVNGAVETRRRKQLHPGDVVECLGEQIEVASQ
jgi:ribosome-associated protein